jgi:protein phosphatase
MKIKYYAISDCGKVRKQNQDRFLIPDNKQQKSNECQMLDAPVTVAVFDGMGGESSGEVAAMIAQQVSEAVFEKYPDCSLKKLIQQINIQICKYMQENDIKSMGTTAVLLRLKDDVAEVCNIGDSRAYRVADKKMMRLSKDHAMNVGSKRVLTQNLGIPESEMVIEPYHICRKVGNGDIFLLCSDGLTDMVSEKRILNIINNCEFEEAGQLLFNEAMENGGKDNTTIVLCKVV